jgi:hypothetical protein
MCESAFNVLYKIMDFWNPTPRSLADIINISEEPSIFDSYPEDGGSMFTPTHPQYVTSYLPNYTASRRSRL